MRVHQSGGFGGGRGVRLVDDIGGAAVGGTIGIVVGTVGGTTGLVAGGVLGAHGVGGVDGGHTAWPAGGGDVGGLGICPVTRGGVDGGHTIWPAGGSAEGVLGIGPANRGGVDGGHTAWPAGGAVGGLGIGPGVDGGHSAWPVAGGAVGGLGVGGVDHIAWPAGDVPVHDVHDDSAHVHVDEAHG